VAVKAREEIIAEIRVETFVIEIWIAIPAPFHSPERFWRNLRSRAVEWSGMRQTLKPAGLLIIQGYTPKQLAYGTGGPKLVENLYTRKMLEEAFSDFDDLRIVEEEREMSEGTSHRGISALINLTARKPKRVGRNGLGLHPV
jgi:hypothetical protein